jgi:hypothetical protein
MKYLSFSLWGCDKVYNIGIIRNAILSKKLYPEWKFVVFYDESVPLETIVTLEMLDVKLINMSNSKIYGMFWRFLAIDFDDCEYAIFRDADSRISKREVSAVNAWIESKKALHIMRDHPAHIIPYGNDSVGIMGGMWGIKGRLLNITDLISNYQFITHEKIYGNDQKFLKIIYEMFKNDSMVHDEFYEKKSFPIKREGKRFIGERIGIFEEPITNECDDL